VVPKTASATETPSVYGSRIGQGKMSVLTLAMSHF
jgi:hypothetical protein